MQRITRAGAQRSQLLPGLLALLAMLLAGCATSGTGGPQLDPNQVFTWPIIGTTQFSDLVLDPANVSDYPSSTVTNAIYGGLVTSDHNLNVVPDMATLDISPDGRQYTFHLRSNLRFSDGTPIIAQDFAYSIDRALDPNVCVAVSGAGCSPVASTYLGDIKGAADRLNGNTTTIIGTGVTTPDAQTLIINLDRPVAYFLEALTYPTSFPVEQSLVKKYGAAWTQHLDEGGCSGPFMIKSYGNGKELILAPNPYWYGKKPTLKEIVRPYVKDADTAYSAYRQGQYDYTDVPTDEYQAARDQEDFHEVGLLQTNYVGMNQDYGPLKDLRVRQALALALNKQLIADRVLDGAALPTNHIVPEGMPGFDDVLTAPGSNTRTLTGDITTAQNLLKHYYADCNCHSLNIILSYPDTPDRQRTAEAMASIWNTVLPGTTIVPQAVPTLHDLVVELLNTTGNHTGALQMWLIGWIADYPDPQDWLSLQFSPTSPYNWANYQDGTQNGQNFTAWQILQQADTEQNPTKRMVLYNQAEQQLVNDVAWLPYIQPKGIWRIRTYIQGYDPSALNLMSDQDWPNVVVLAHQ